MKFFLRSQKSSDVIQVYAFWSRSSLSWFGRLAMKHLFSVVFDLCWTVGKPSTFLPATWSWPTWHLPLALRPSCHRLHRMIRRWSNHRRPYHPWFPHFMQAPRKGAPQFMDMNFNFYFMIFLRQDVVFEDAPFQALERQLYVTPLNSLSLAHHLLRLLRPRREWRRA